MSGQRHTGILFCSFGLLVALLATTGCPPVQPPADEDNGDIVGPTTLLVQTSPTAPFTATFSPTEAGRRIDVTVVGNGRASRPRLTVTDAGGTVVGSDAASGTAAAVSFVSAGTDTYTVSVEETATAPTSYTLRVLQTLIGS